MKFISWNVNGLRACMKPKTDDNDKVISEGFEYYFNQLDADFFCLQETKMQAGQLDLNFLGYHAFWNYADKKGYSGTAIFSKHKPINVTYGIGIDKHDLDAVLAEIDSLLKSSYGKTVNAVILEDLRTLGSAVSVSVSLDDAYHLRALHLALYLLNIMVKSRHVDLSPDLSQSLLIHILSPYKCISIQFINVYTAKLLPSSASVQILLLSATDIKKSRGTDRRRVIFLLTSFS